MVDRLKMKNIQISDLKDVEISVSLKQKGYGRRFTVALKGPDGVVGSEKNVVFKDLYSKARKLLYDSNHYLTPEELKDLSLFIVKLKAAEVEGNTYYKTQGSGYKFRTFFHRVFSGGYRGSHADRLSTLHHTVNILAEANFRDIIRSIDPSSLPKRMIIPFGDKTYNVVKIAGRKAFAFWEEQAPDKIASIGGNRADLVTIRDDSAAIICAIIREIENHAGKAAESSDLRDQFVQSFKDVFDSKDVSFKGVEIDGKKYSIEGRDTWNGYTISIQAMGKNGMAGLLEIRNGHAQYERRDLSIIPEEFVSVFEGALGGIQEHLDKEKERELAYILQLKGVFDNPDAFSEALTLMDRYSSGNLNDYKVWTEGNFLKIQEKKYQGTDQGLLQIDKRDHRIQFEGNNETPMSEAAKSLFEAAIFAVYKDSSSYSNTAVNIYRQSLNHIPEWHLGQLIDSLRSSRFNVRYRDEAGIDMGGLKREYIGKLASLVSSRDNLFTDADGSLKIPRIISDQESSVLNCNAFEKTIYRNFGQLLQLCHASRPSHGYYEENLITTGRLFSDAVFKAAFKLSKDDLAKPLSDNKDAQIRMARAVLKHLDKKSSDNVKNVRKCFKLLEGDNLGKDKRIAFAFFMLPESVREAYENEDYDPDMEKIKANQEQFKNDLFNALMKDSTTVDELNGIPLGSMLDPIYQIASGMSERIPDWDATRVGSVDAFSAKVQGSIDRSQIIANMEFYGDSNVVNQKITWLKEWINEASDAEIQSFLKFTTGAASMPVGTKIKIDEQVQCTPMISVSTCNMTLHMSGEMQYNEWGRENWDDTKEKFVANLKAAINTEGFQRG